MSVTARGVFGRAGKVVGVGVVIVLALVVILTALRTELPRSPGVMSDALGPDAGEPVSDYLARAAASLEVDDDEVTTGEQDGDGPVARWALVTAERPWSVADAVAVVSGLPRLSGVYVQTPLPGVAMPVGVQTTAEPVSGEHTREPVLARALGRAADAAEARAVAGDGRPAAVEELTAQRIRDGQPAIIGLVVRGEAEGLRAVAGEAGVRSVEELPADAVWGHFAVRPLLPQQVDAADPLPDHAPVGAG